jgi:hypothetical protein
MNAHRLALVPALAVFLLAASGCASDKNREVKHAEANLKSEEQEASTDQARLDQKHAQEVAEAQLKPTTADDRAELQGKQQEERAEVKAEGQREIADADKDVADARTAMQNEKTTTLADAKERFNKADAKAWQAKNKSARLAMNRRAKFNADWNAVASKKSEVQNRLGALSTVSKDEWKDAKAKLEKSLDELEWMVRRLDEDL